MIPKVAGFALVGLGLVSLGASCALPFWDLPVGDDVGGASASSGSTTTTETVASSTSGAPECIEPAAPVCGSPTQQCTDGNSFKLDGCNDACGYEVVQRMNNLAISIDTGPSFCVHSKNQFGHAIDPSLIGILDQPVADNLNNGGLNILTHFHCLDDLSGANASGFTIGVLDGLLDPSKGLWPAGSAPEDWSFLVDGAAVSAASETYVLSPANIVNHALVAGPSSIKMKFPLAGADGALKLDNAIIHATVGATTSRPGPSDLNVSQDLMVFDSLTATGQEQGLCGDITIQSLAQIAVSAQIAKGGVTPCVEAFKPCGSDMIVGPTCNSMLDVLVVGCTIGTVPAAKPTQPDVPGNGGTVTALTADANNKVTIPVGDNDGYSSYFTFAMLRQHIAGQSCSTVDDCQSGQMCVASVCTPR